MTDTSVAQLTNDIIQVYLTISDTTRMLTLPSWITSDMSLSHLKAIVLLEYHSALTISELAKSLGLGKPAASLLVQQLVERELVERTEDAKDRRRAIVRPTARGVGLIAGRREQIRAALQRWLERLDRDDLASLHRGLAALIRVVKSETIAQNITT